MESNVNITIKFSDKDEAMKFDNWIRQYVEVVSFKILPNIEHLKEDEPYKKLRKAKRDIQLQLDRYLNNNR